MTPTGKNNSLTASYFSESSFSVQDTDEMLRDFEERNLQRGSRSIKYGTIIDALADEYLKGEKENFDNYGAEPVKHKAYMEAVKFINRFPLDLLEKLPEPYLDPEGGIGFDWENENASSSFAVSFTGDGKIYYAGLFKNGDKVHGSGYFYGDNIPEEVIRSVFKVYR